MFLFETMKLNEVDLNWTLGGEGCRRLGGGAEKAILTREETL